MTCSECGAEVDVESNFCSNCGAEISDDRGKADAKTKDTGADESNSKSDASEKDNFDHKQGKAISRRRILGVLGLGGVITGGVGYLSLPKERIIPKGESGIIEKTLSVDRKSYININNRFRYYIYSESENQVYDWRGLTPYDRFAYTEDAYDNPPTPRSSLLPAGKYTVIARRNLPIISTSPVSFFRNTRTETAPVSDYIEYLSRRYIEISTYIPEKNENDDGEALYGSNLSQRVTAAVDRTTTGHGEPLTTTIDRSRASESMIKPAVQNSDSSVQQQYQQLVKENELWRSGISTAIVIDNIIDNIIDDFISNLNNSLDIFETIPGDVFSKSIQFLSENTNDSEGPDVLIGFYSARPSPENTDEVNVPIGIHMYTTDDIPFSSEYIHIYTPTVQIPSVRTQADSAPIWEPAVQDVQSELIEKFNDIL